MEAKRQAIAALLQAGKTPTVIAKEVSCSSIQGQEANKRWKDWSGPCIRAKDEDGIDPDGPGGRKTPHSGGPDQVTAARGAGIGTPQGSSAARRQGGRLEVLEAGQGTPH